MKMMTSPLHRNSRELSRRTLPPRRRRHDGAAVAGIGPGLGRRRGERGRRVPKRFARCSWATASTPTTGGPRARGADMELGKSLAAAGAAQGQAQRHQRPVQQERHRRRHPSGADRQYPLRRAAARRAPSCAAASAWTRCSPTTSARTPCSPAWSSAASSRSPAITRRTSRWPTARTSRGRAPTSPVPMEVYPVAGVRQPVRQPRQPAQPEHPRPRQGAGRDARPAGQLGATRPSSTNTSPASARSRSASQRHARREREGRRAARRPWPARGR